jgi:hypothetical protein
MSTRVSAKARMTAACQELLKQRLNISIAATVELADVGTITSLERVDLSHLHQMMNSDLLTGALGTLAPDPFGRARDLLASTDQTAGNAWAAAASVQSELDRAVSEAQAKITHTVRDITTEVFAEAGADLGYTASIYEGDTMSGVELRRAHEVILLRIHDGGAVESDHAGLVDATCGDRQRELEEAAARRGLALTDRRQRDHGAAQGGDLIVAAAHRRDSSLARATVFDAEQVPVKGARLFDSERTTAATRRTGISQRGGAA